jgi:hypothetical protein
LWTYVIDLPPKRRQKSKGGFPTEKAADATCAEEITNINKGLYIKDSNMTLEEFMNLWLRDYAETKLILLLA